MWRQVTPTDDGVGLGVSLDPVLMGGSGGPPGVATVSLGVRESGGLDPVLMGGSLCSGGGGLPGGPCVQRCGGGGGRGPGAALWPGGRPPL